MADLTKVRTTFEPHREVEVGPQELLDLQRQGLIYQHEPTKARQAATEKGDD